MKLVTFKISQGETYAKRNAFSTQKYAKWIWVIYWKEFCSVSSLSFDVWIVFTNKKGQLGNFCTCANWLCFTLPKCEWNVVRNKEGQRWLSNTSQWQSSLAIPVWLEQEIWGHSSCPGSFSPLQMNTQSLPTLMLPYRLTFSETMWILPFSPLPHARWRRCRDFHVEPPISGQV